MPVGLFELIFKRGICMVNCLSMLLAGGNPPLRASAAYIAI
jgi:hypothetical protein